MSFYEILSVRYGKYIDKNNIDLFFIFVYCIKRVSIIFDMFT